MRRLQDYPPGDDKSGSAPVDEKAQTEQGSHTLRHPTAASQKHKLDPSGWTARMANRLLGTGATMWVTLLVTRGNCSLEDALMRL